MPNDQDVTQYQAWTRSVAPMKGPWTCVSVGSYAECEREAAVRKSANVQAVIRPARDGSPAQMSQHDREQAVALVERERITFAEALARVMADRI